MGKLVNCYLDPRGLMEKKMFEDLTTEKNPSSLPPVEEEDDTELPDIPPEDDNVPFGGEFDDRVGGWDRERGWPGEKGWEGRRPKHWKDEETQGA